jgi:hypothetical protein
MGKFSMSLELGRAFGDKACPPPPPTSLSNTWRNATKPYKFGQHLIQIIFCRPLFAYSQAIQQRNEERSHETS